jgi:hypothetical protein
MQDAFRQGQLPDRMLVCVVQAQGGAAGHHDLKGAFARLQFSQVQRGREEVLEVVEDQKRPRLCGKPADQSPGIALIRGEGKLSGGDVEHLAQVAQGNEVHELHVAVHPLHPLRQVQGEGCLADAAGTAQGDEPAPGVQKVSNPTQIVLAAQQEARPCRMRCPALRVHGSIYKSTKVHGLRPAFWESELASTLTGTGA